MQRKTPFVKGEFYHIYNRGVDKRTIFSSTVDFKRFLVLLYLANSDQAVRIDNLLKTCSYEEIFGQERGAPLVAIGAYCLMPNHFHLLLTPLVEGGLPKFMLKLQTGYSMYFNTKYERNGSLFQGPFRSEHADKDEYLKYLFSYIHLNPAKLKDPAWKEKPLQGNRAVTSFVEQYPYSSYQAFLSNKHSVIDLSVYPKYFTSIPEVKRHIHDWFHSTNI